MIPAPHGLGFANIPPIVRSRIVLPDGNGRTFTMDYTDPNRLRLSKLCGREIRAGDIKEWPTLNGYTGGVYTLGVDGTEILCVS